jgi:DNA-damage-inducible protein J
MATTNITIRMDEELKKQAEQIFNDMGMNITTAFTIFTKAEVRKVNIPFEVSADPFYSEANQAHLKKVLASKGKNIVKTMEELEAMENE